MLAPIYKRLGGDEGRREAQEEGLYKPRNAKLLDMLLDLDLDVLCLQEFWLESPVLRRLYREKLAGYRLLETPRTSRRGDGLLTAVRERNVAVVDKRDIIFTDCGDRVAQLVRLRRKGGGGGDGGEFLLVSTHLLFPHNRNSSLIRLRETYKILEFVERYRDAHQLPPLPLLLCGDLNGTGSGNVSTFLKSQGFVSTLDATLGGRPWISHLSHRNEVVDVDFIYLLSSETRARFQADWRRTVFAMIEAKFLERGSYTTEDAFKALDRNGDGVLQREEFFQGMATLGLCGGDDTIGLTDDEMGELLECCRSEGGDCATAEVTFEAFCRVLNVEDFEAAYNRIKETNGIWEGAWEGANWGATDLATASGQGTCILPPARKAAPAGPDLSIVEASIPSEFVGATAWPEDWGHSDHAPVSVRLSF